MLIRLAHTSEAWALAWAPVRSHVMKVMSGSAGEPFVFFPEGRGGFVFITASMSRQRHREHQLKDTEWELEFTGAFATGKTEIP